MAGNLIGTDLHGTAAWATSLPASRSRAGRERRSADRRAWRRNMISGNAGNGVDLNNGATGTLIQGNYIGVDQTGTQPLGNAATGSRIDSAGATIGGTRPATAT